MATDRLCVGRVWTGGKDRQVCGAPVAIIAERPSLYCDRCIQDVTTAAYGRVLDAKSKLQAALDAYQRTLEDCFPKPDYG